MAQNFYSPGDTPPITWVGTKPATIVNEGLAIEGVLVGVITSVDEVKKEAIFRRNGCWILDKPTTIAYTQGQKVYASPTTKLIVASSTAGAVAIGAAFLPAAQAATQVHVVFFEKAEADPAP